MSKCDICFSAISAKYGGDLLVRNVNCTPGGSGIGKTAEKLKSYAPGAEVVEAKLLSSPADAKAWVK